MEPSIWLLVIAWLTMTRTITTTPNVEDFNMEALAKSSELFAINVFKELITKPGDILISPSSLHTILALVQQGARGETLDDMSKILGLPSDKSSVRSAFCHLTHQDTSSLLTSTGIFLGGGVEPSTSFAKSAIDAFNATIEKLDLKDAKTAAERLDAWVRQNTGNKIQKLVTPETLDARSSLLLVNALYFGGKWQTAFNDKLTRPKLFYGEKEQLVDMMTAEMVAMYGEDEKLDCKFLELPLGDGELVMRFVLPSRKKGLSGIEGYLDRVLNPQNVQPTQVLVTIPKFNITHELQFDPILQKLGLARLFGDEADLSDMAAGGRSLRVSHVLQRSRLELTEYGAEAASATVAFVIDRIFGGETTFHATHPFLFSLRELNSGQLHLLGRFTGLQSH